MKIRKSQGVYFISRGCLSTLTKVLVSKRNVTLHLADGEVLSIPRDESESIPPKKLKTGITVVYSSVNFRQLNAGEHPPFVVCDKDDLIAVEDIINSATKNPRT